MLCIYYHIIIHNKKYNTIMHDKYILYFSVYIYIHMHVCIYRSKSNSQHEQGILNILPL